MSRLLTHLGTWTLGWIWWLLLPIRRGVAITNLHRALPGAPTALLRRAVGSVAWGYLELLAGRPVRWQGLEEARGGAILFTAHLGPWDLCLLRAARIAPLTVFLKTPSSRLAAWLIARLRADPTTDLEALPVTGSIAAAHRALERGRVVVFVLDQRHNHGIAVPFFGHSAWTSAAFAAMVHRHRPRLFATVQWRDRLGELHARAHRLHWRIPDDRDEAIRALTTRTQQWLEHRIREHPADWWWLHKRWRQPT